MNYLAGGHSVFGDSGLGSNQTLNIGAFAAKYGGVTVTRFKPGTVLYSQGEPADALFYVRDGQVQITVVSSLGKAGILGVLGSGELCGEGSLLGNEIRVATAECMVESSIARLERSSVIRGVRDDAAIAEYFVAFALASVVRLRENLISQLFDCSEKRLARILLALAHHDIYRRHDNIIRNVDQEELAQMIGTTRSRVNHFMNKFRKLGCIDYDGRAILVHESLSTLVLHEHLFDAFEPPASSAAVPRAVGYP